MVTLYKEWGSVSYHRMISWSRYNSKISRAIWRVALLQSHSFAITWFVTAYYVIFGFYNVKAMVIYMTT